MKRLLAFLLALLALLGTASAEDTPIPARLCITQEQGPDEYVREDVYIRKTYPVTENADVNAQMRQLIDRMAEEGRGALPTGRIGRDKTSLRVNAGMSRTGDRWMSFLTIARIQHEREQIYVAFDARAYDMETGRCLTMDDLFDEDSEGWTLLAQAVETQLSVYFPEETCDGEKLRALCGRDALREAAFTLTGGSLRLHYRADELYPGHQGLMHVRLLYPDIRPAMRQEAQARTDNSSYKLAALTFDDGPAQLYSINVIDELRARGADATFFLVGNMMAANHYVLSYEHDAGFLLAYHSYEHQTSGRIRENAHADLARFNRELSQVTGTQATMMRAPGGMEKPYIDVQIGLPLIHWSVSSGDGSANRSFDDAAIRTMGVNAGGGAKDGAVIMMHDLRRACYRYLDIALDRLEERGFLCVTVEELFALRGVDLEPHQVYFGE